tara:strand:- start:2063 stop:2731 length:669 start_codon:yes stop_codon:yes gene_type:complete
MKTVRLSSNLKYDIRTAAERKWDKANPQKEYPSDGMQLFVDLGYQLKVDATFKSFKDIWGFDCPTNEVDKLCISGEHTYTVPKDSLDDEYEETETKSYTLRLPDVSVPGALVKYGDEMHVKVPHDNPTFLQCIEVEMFNRNLRDKKHEYLGGVKSGLNQFATLNQLIKQAPEMSSLVPQDRLQKMHEKDDRTQRAKEQKEIAESQFAELREVLLEDALLGDD